MCIYICIYIYVYLYITNYKDISFHPFPPRRHPRDPGRPCASAFPYWAPWIWLRIPGLPPCFPRPSFQWSCGIIPGIIPNHVIS